jgi:hypothetical protein
MSLTDQASKESSMRSSTVIYTAWRSNSTRNIVWINIAESRWI